MSDIFICYSNKDRSIATQLQFRLREAGWSVFIDTDIHAGDYWSEEIQRQLNEARAVLALWSSNSVRSRFVMDEANEAADRGILFPVRIEEINIPYGFRIIQTRDLIGWGGYGVNEQWEELTRSLRKCIDGEVNKHLPQFVVGRSFRDELRMGGQGPAMMVIPEGRFLMGSALDEPERSEDEGPQHEVLFSEPFAIGVYLVTFEDYDRFCHNSQRAKPEDKGWGRKKRPVIYVSWQDARAYCDWLSEQTERTYRLPSEAEWEYACRAGTVTPFNVGPRISTDQSNFNGNATYNGSDEEEYRARTLPVGSFQPNAYGLYEMHGNVRDWCEDSWHDNYENAPTDGSAWKDSKSKRRVVRGGSWVAAPVYIRSAARDWSDLDDRSLDVGFRVVCSAPAK